ncbi:hypothetical protein [Nocardia wallacei]|uniref:hypothetical protein n=1 Tax=Nocardia wallacei TaxID=480035 RepID=UPI002455CFC6|nr:hypothetical protein [Nocardia wallacei]
MPVDDSGPVYEVRFGVTPSGMLAVVGGVAAAVVTILGEGVPYRPLVFACAVLVAGTFLAIMLSRKVALRVDSDGVTLGGRAFWRHHATTVTVPWPEITGVVVYYQWLPNRARLSYLGIQRHPDHSGPQSRLEAEAARASGLGDVATIAVARPITGWRLDRDQLTTVVHHHAPHVTLSL